MQKKFFVVASVLTVFALLASCVHPQGVSVSAVDGGIQTCVNWAQQNCQACLPLEGGAPIPTFVDAAGGK